MSAALRERRSEIGGLIDAPPAPVPGVLGSLIALPATALAAGPVRETAVFDFPDPAVFGECDGFEMIATSAHIERQTLTWHDEDGNPLHESRLFFDFTLVNSVSGTEARYTGRFHRTADFITGADALWEAGLCEAIA